MTNWIFTIVVLIGILVPLRLAHAHGTPHPRPTPEQAESIPPPVPGAKEFFELLAGHGRALLSQQEATQLEEISASFAFEEQIRNGQDGEAGPHDADYNRYLGETGLLKLVQGMSDTIVVDFREGPPSADPFTPIPLPGPIGTLHIKVVTGDGAPQFRVQRVNLTSSGDGKPFVVPIAAQATTHVLLDLEEIPSGESTLVMAFKEDGAAEPRFWHAVTVRQQPLGQLRVEVLDESGETTPVFMRLTAKANGKLWEPPNAVDVSPIMTSVTGLPIYGPGRGYTHFMPGEFRGTYWIVPKPFELALPPGEWEIHIHHGAEYTPVYDTFTVNSGEWTRKTYRMARWTNMPKRGWWSGDDHVHAKLTSSEDAERIMAFVRAANINVANILEMGNQDRTWYAQRGFGPEFRVALGNHILVPGQEDPRSAFGHTIGMNVTSMVRDLDHYYLTDLVADEIHKQGGLYGHTHVGEGGLGVHRDMALLMPRGKSDFGSIMQNILGTERYYDFLDLGFQLVASAGTDTPYGGAVGVVRCYAFLGEDTPFSADGWFAAFARGRTFVTNGPMLDLRVDDAYPGDTIKVGEDRPLRVKVRAWGLAGGSAPARLELVRCSEVVREAVSEDAQRDALEIETELPAEFGYWIAARVTGHDGSQAHTTPVYVTRDGFRHWNVQRAEQLLRDRLDTLNEIDGLVSEAETKKRDGRLQPLDRWNGLMADQAPQVRERTALVRSIYQDLSRTLETELTLRGTVTAP